MKQAIRIGVSKQTVVEARRAINDILSATVDQATKQVALETLQKLCMVQNINISNNLMTDNYVKNLPVGDGLPDDV